MNDVHKVFVKLFDFFFRFICPNHLLGCFASFHITNEENSRSTFSFQSIIVIFVLLLNSLAPDVIHLSWYTRALLLNDSTHCVSTQATYFPGVL